MNDKIISPEPGRRSKKFIPPPVCKGDTLLKPYNNEVQKTRSSYSQNISHISKNFELDSKQEKKQIFKVEQQKLDGLCGKLQDVFNWYEPIESCSNMPRRSVQIISQKTPVSDQSDSQNFDNNETYQRLKTYQEEINCDSSSYFRYLAENYDIL